MPTIECQLATGYLNELYDLGFISYEDKEQIENQIKAQFGQVNKEALLRKVVGA